MTTATLVMTGISLAGAAGLNAWIPLLATAIAARAGAFDLAEPYAQIATTTGIVVLSALLVVDFVADKVPALDSVVHAVGTVVHPASGAIVAASQAGADIPPVVLLIAGGITSEGVHLGRAAVRPLVTGATAGFGNPVISLGEDGTSASLSLLSIFAPVLALIVLLVLTAALALGVRAVLRRRRRRAQAASE